MCTLQKLMRNTVGKKGLAHTGIAVEKQILKGIVKASNKVLRKIVSTAGGLAFCESR